MPLLTNPFLVYDLLKILGLGSLFPFFVIVALAFWEGDYVALPFFARVSALLFAGLLIASALIVLVVFGNRFTYEYRLDRHGARMALLSRTGDWLSSLAILLGLLAGPRGLTTAGAGFLAKANRSAFLPWRELGGAHLYPGSRRITLLNDWRTVIRLEIPESLYTEVKMRVKVELARREARRLEDLRPATAPAIRILLGGLTLLFTVALLGEEKPLAVFPGLVLLAGVAGLVALWTRGWTGRTAAVLVVTVMGGTGLFAWINGEWVNHGQAGWTMACGLQLAFMAFFIGLGLAILSGWVRAGPTAWRKNR